MFFHVVFGVSHSDLKVMSLRLFCDHGASRFDHLLELLEPSAHAVICSAHVKNKNGGVRAIKIFIMREF